MGTLHLFSPLLAMVIVYGTVCTWTHTGHGHGDCLTVELTENKLEERMIDVSPPTDLNRLLISFRGRDVLTKFRLPPPLPLEILRTHTETGPSDS